MQAFSTTPPAYQAASVGDTNTLIFSGTGTTLGGTAYSFPATETEQLIVQNSGDETVYIGGSGVTTTAVAVPSGESVIVPVTTGPGSTFALYGITASGTTQVEAALASVTAEN